MEYRWKLSPPPDEVRVRKLAEALGVPTTIGAILVNRGVDTFEAAKNYFRPSLDLLHDPFLMDGMGTAVGRVSGAIERHERILVFGDYDVDGTNGAAMLYLVLKSLGASVFFHA